MRILFSMRHPGVLRNFASTLQALAARNHQFTSCSASRTRKATIGCSTICTRAFRNITCDEMRRKTPWRFWLGVGRAARYSVDYVRYLTPEYDRIISLKERARGKAPALMRWFVERPFWRSPHRQPFSHPRPAGHRARHPDRPRGLRSRPARAAGRPAGHAARGHRLRPGGLRQGRARASAFDRRCRS